MSFFLFTQVENRALRLKDVGTAPQQYAEPEVFPQESTLSQEQQQVREQQINPQNNKEDKLINMPNTNYKTSKLIQHPRFGGLGLNAIAPETSRAVSWDYFDESGYISRGSLRTGEDPYIRNRFNQQASDSLPSNREIPDTRHPM